MNSFFKSVFTITIITVLAGVMLSLSYSLTKDKLSFDSFCKDSFYTLCESEKEAYKILEDEKMKDDLISYIKESLNDLTIEQLQSIKDMLIF